MNFPSNLIRGKLVQRYKRFLADVRLDTGAVVTAACPNTGSMLGLKEPGSVVWLSVSQSKTRKYPHTWEMIELAGHGLVGINTGSPNKIVAEAITAGGVAVLRGYASRRAEVKYGRNSRIDLLLEDPARPPCYVEVKNVHLLRQPGLAEFPDCVTERGAKHLDEMSAMVAAGSRAVMVYLIQCETPRRFTLAGDFDPYYVKRYRAARAAGVEAIALTCKMSVAGITVLQSIPVEDP
jgi:sugar fermentation stimulation protein A